ncbi:hypothetical protein [Salisediminibacterium beveridgei]|uniref:ABC-2 type transport system permease protein n=1 Tax=Salisediminibacterium beveridgei TaxID=632773 RepID=A0A1D7QRA8_9BACI|nr:hypothetical protein [Salisediminibacterium beveridgei]AOM81538.1 hypothetical protein BBEV_0143 [Salisediminibacterium beveridgei]
MKSVTSLLNKSLFRMQLSTVTWIGFFLTVSLLVVLPISILTRELSAAGNSSGGPGLFYGSELNTLMAFSYPFQLLIMATFPVLLAVILMNFMTKKPATDLMHSLPFTREKILGHLYTVGLTVLTAPLVLTGAVLMIINPMLDERFYSMGDIVVWMLLTLFMMLLIFSLAMFTGILVGNSLLHGVLTYVLIFVPALLVILSIVNLQYFIVGLAQTAYIEAIALNGIIFARWMEMTYDPLGWVEFLAQGGVALLLIGASFVLYKRRQSEATEETLVFRGVRHVFLYGLTFFFMLLAGVYFTEVLRGGMVWTYIGYAIGAVISYTFLQMIIQKALRLRWPWKDFAVFAGAVILLLVPIEIGSSYYEQHIPAAEDVAYAQIHTPNMDMGFGRIQEERQVTDEATIEAITDLHSDLLAHAQTNPDSWHRIELTYQLNNGNTIQREYTVTERFLEEETLALREMDGFKRTYDPAYLIEDVDITYATVQGNLGHNMDGDRIADPADLNALMDAMRHDVEQRPAQVFISERGSTIGSIRFETADNDSVHFYLTAQDPATMAFLNDQGFYDGLLVPENIETMYVMEWLGDHDFYDVMNRLEMNEVAPEDLTDNVLIVEEDEEQQELLDYGHAYEEMQYVAILRTDYGYTFYGFESYEVPQFVIDHFEE